MHRREVDVAIIGSGTAGLTARRAALAAGAKRVVMIEGGPYGTTCARVGCMPSKLLIAAADARHHAQHSEVFGLRPEAPLRVDGAAVMKRIKDERDRFVGFVERSVERIDAEQKIRGWARFAASDILSIALEAGGELRLRASAIVIATGTEPWSPPAFENLGDRLLTNEDIFELSDLPESLAVIGTGVIGLELGQAMARLGVRVTLFNRSDRVGPLADPELQALGREIFANELNFELSVDAQARPLAPEQGEGVEITWTDKQGQARKDRFDYVLSAAGRRPNLSRLGLDQAGVELDAQGMPDFDPQSMQIEHSSIFVAGDFTQTRSLLHEAADEGRIAGQNAARYPEVIRHTRRTPLAIVFSDPNIAAVGLDYAELKADCHTYGEVDYGDQGRARVMAQNRGKVRIWGDVDSGRLLGAQMIGPRVEHTAHLLAWAIEAGLTVDRALEMPFYHPVIEEGIRSALRDLAHKIKHADISRLDCSPGV